MDSEAAERQAVASPCDFRGPVALAVGSALPRGACRWACFSPAAVRQAVVSTCDFMWVGAGRSGTWVGSGQKGPKLVGLWGSGGPIGPKARIGGGVGLEHDGHLASGDLHGFGGWPRMDLGEPPGLHVVAQSVVPITMARTSDASSDHQREMFARLGVPFGARRLRQLPPAGAGRARLFWLLFLELAF